MYVRSLLATMLFSLPLFANDSVIPSDIARDYRVDPKKANQVYQGRAVDMEVVIDKRIVDNGNTYYQIAAEGMPKGGRLLFKLPKSFRVGDKIAVTATLKLDRWVDDRALYFDAIVTKELDVKPPLFNCAQLLTVKKPEAWVSQKIDLQGVVTHLDDGGIVLSCLEHIDRVKGIVVLDRPIITVHFADDSIAKAKLERGNAVEIRGTVEFFRAGRVIIKDATLLK